MAAENIEGIKNNPHTSNIPVVILTTSSAKKEMDYCIQNGASKYFNKTVTIQGFSETVSTIVKVATENN